MTLVELVAEFSASVGVIFADGVVIGSQSAQTRQMGKLLNRFCDDLVTRQVYQQNTLECVFTPLPQEDQGSISSIAPYGFRGILLKTFYDRTRNLQVLGGIRPQEYQQLKSMRMTGPYPNFRIRQNRLLLYPAPAASSTFAFEYFSAFFVQDSTGTPKQYWTLDSDSSIFNDELPLAWLNYAWRREKGLDYAEAFMSYEMLLASLSARDNTPRPVSMSASEYTGPGIVIPPGNWLQTP